MTEICHEHSGCVTDIKNLKLGEAKIWKKISNVESKVDAIMARLNVILGCIVVATIMLLINLTFKIV